MKKLLFVLAFLSLAACASAQPRPGAFTTLTATTVTTTGNITDGGTLTTTGAATVGGLLTVTGFGTHTFSAGGTGGNILNLRNTTAGTGNFTQLTVGNNTGQFTGEIITYSSTYTSANGFDAADGTVLANTGAGGLSLFSQSSSIRFYAPTERMRLDASGNLLLGTTIVGNGPGSLSAAATGMTAGYDGGTSAYASLTNQGLTLSQAGASVFLTVSSLASSGISIGTAPANVNLNATGLQELSWPTTASAANAQVANGNFIRLVTSLRSAKHDIEPIALSDARRTVMGLHAVLYQSAVDDDQRQWAGFIADDVERVNPVLAVYRPDGALQSVTYDRVPAFLLPVVQDHEARLLALEKALAAR